MAKKKTKRRARPTIPLAVVAGFMAPARIIYRESLSNGIEGGVAATGRIFTGYDSTRGVWDFRQLQFGFGPVLMGFGIHKVATMLGVNRALGAARIPFIRI